MCVSSEVTERLARDDRDVVDYRDSRAQWTTLQAWRMLFTGQQFGGLEGHQGGVLGDRGRPRRSRQC
jgi:hypothetical protein